MSNVSVRCPACETENDAQCRTCVKCGAALIAVCPRCTTVNACTADRCTACGQPLDTLGQIMARHEVRLSDRFTRQAGTAIGSKSDQKDQDRSRSQELWAQEQRRQEYLQAQKKRQKQQERYLIMGVVAVVVIMLVIILLISLAR